ncbi:MAG: hypothetical protein JWM86_987 [Thermoleophilia bacterium]|nr:hypothetical protein [Thermoleophilia bacterium]
MTIRRRVALGITLSTILIVALASITLVIWLRRSMTDTIDRGLRVRADEAATALEATNLPNLENPERHFADDDDGVFQVIDEHGRSVIGGSGKGGDLKTALTGVRAGDERTRRIRDTQVKDDAFRTLAFGAETGDSRPVIILLGAPLEARDDAVSALVLALLALTPMLTLLIIASATYQLGLPLRAVHRICTEARRIRGTNDAERISDHSGVTEIDQLAAEVNDMLDRLRDATARQRRFVAVASHEFRTPLATAKSHADALELQLAAQLNSDQRRHLAGTHQELDRLVQIADSLLLLTEQERDGIRLTIRNEPAEQLLHSIIERFSARAELTGRTITCADDDLHHREWAVDRVLIEQAVGNLIDNSLRHGQGTTTIYARSNDEVVSVWVTDEGPGISPQQASFEPFAAAGASTGGTHRGSGLGLSIVRAIARAHNGDCALHEVNGAWAAVIEIPAKQET